MTEANQQATVPIEALTSVQTALDDANKAAADAAATAAEKAEADAAELAALRAQVAASDEVIALAKQRTDALEALNRALEAKKVAAELAVEAAAAGANFSRASSKERWRITIDEARDSTDIQVPFVAVNGRAYQIRRMVPVDVPREVISVLNDAVMGRPYPVVDERTGVAAGVAFKPARRFPFQTHGQSKDKDGNWMQGYSETGNELTVSLS